MLKKLICFNSIKMHPFQPSSLPLQTPHTHTHSLSLSLSLSLLSQHGQPSNFIYAMVMLDILCLHYYSCCSRVASREIDQVLWFQGLSLIYSIHVYIHAWQFHTFYLDMFPYNIHTPFPISFFSCSFGYDKQIQTMTVNKLCNSKQIVTVNNMFPGPVVYAQQGDRLIVKVSNESPYNATIHW
jgi:hypothetical protein